MSNRASIAGGSDPGTRSGRTTAPGGSGPSSASACAWRPMGPIAQVAAAQAAADAAKEGGFMGFGAEQVSDLLV